MKSFFSRIATIAPITTISMAVAIAGSLGYSTTSAFALNAGVQQVQLSKEEKKRQEEAEKKKKEEEKKLKKQEEQKRKEEEKKNKEAAKNNNNKTTSPSSPAGAPAARGEGMDIAILMKNSQGSFAPVNPGGEFKNGDQFRVEYNSKLNGIVYFVNVDPKGTTRVIYRDEVRNGQKYVHPAPGRNEVIEFRGSTGTEVLRIVMSLNEIAEFENALRNSEGRFGTSQQQVKDELVGFVVPEPAQACGGLELASGGMKVKCRELIIAKVNPKQGQISVSVSADGQGQASPNAFNLKPGEVAVLEIRLKHVSR